MYSAKRLSLVSALLSLSHTYFLLNPHSDEHNRVLALTTQKYLCLDL